MSIELIKEPTIQSVEHVRVKTLIQRLEDLVTVQPDTPLYSFLDGSGDVVDSYTYRRFHERTNYLAQSLCESGAIRHGQPVLLVYPPGLEFIVAFFACVKVGAVPVPVPPLDASSLSGGLQKLSAIVRNCGATVALTTEEQRKYVMDKFHCNAEAAQWLGDELLAVLEWRSTDVIRGESTDFETHTGSLLFLQYTSGSTQTPRGVMVSHHNVLHNAMATLDHCPIAVSWLPHYHDMGLIGYYLFVMLRGGSTYIFSGSHFLKRPRLWLEVISRYGATITSAPNFAYEYCLREDKIHSDRLEGLDLSSLRCMMNAAEPVRATTCERFLAKFEACGLPRRSLVVYYGLAENTLTVSGNGRIRVAVNTHLLEQGHLRLESPRPEAYDQTRLVSCGHPMSGVDVQIVDIRSGVAVGEDMIGEVWVAGESKSAGYWDNSALTQVVFRATLNGAEMGTTYLRTGDLGFMHDGELFICGRLKDMIIIGGRNYYPNDIEAVVEQACSKIRQGGIAAFAVQGIDGEAIAVLVEARKKNDLPDFDAIAREVRKRCQIEVGILAVVPHGAIARTSSGKVARHECRRRWLDGNIQPIARRDYVRSIDADDPIAQVLTRLTAEGADDATLADIGVDSLTLVELSLYLSNIAREQKISHDLLDLRVLQAVKLGELRAFLSRSRKGTPLPKAASWTYAARLRAIEKNETAVMRRDSRLPREILPCGGAIGGQTILLTGGTGFLGSFLLESLLRHTDSEIVVPVRAEDDTHARNRVESALERTGLWNEKMQAAYASRVKALPGDIGQPRLGLSKGLWDELVQRISRIYHCGAEVDYIKPYHALWSSNVSSTLEVLRLATTGVAKTLDYISTTFMYGFVARDVCRESEFNEEMAGLNFGYTQTKWVSEQLVHQALERGISGRIYRPAFVTASSLGRYVRHDLLARILAYMIRHGVAPDTENQISCVPVDICANNIVALSQLASTDRGSFNITADNYYSMKTICQSITRQYGYEFEYMSLERLIDHLNHHCHRDDPMFPLVAFFNHNFRRIESMREKRYDNQNYRRWRISSSTCLPEPKLDQTVSALVSFLQSEHLVPVLSADAVTAEAIA